MKFSSLCVCASLALIAPTAIADGAKVEKISANLTYDQADLVTAEGATETFKSLKDQAKDACRIDDVTFGPSVDRKCVNIMLSDAVEKIDSPMLTAVYKGTQLPYRVASR